MILANMIKRIKYLLKTVNSIKSNLLTWTTKTIFIFIVVTSITI